MADRYPLVVDSSTGTVKELPTGDNLNLNGSAVVNATVSGEITLTPTSGTTNAVTVNGTSPYDTVITGVGSVGINTSLPNAPLQINLPFQPNGSVLGPSTVGFPTVPTVVGHHGGLAIGSTIGPQIWGASITGIIGGGSDGARDGGGIEIGGGPSVNKGTWISLAGANRGDGWANFLQVANGPQGNFYNRLRINPNGNISLGSSLGIATDVGTRVAAGYGTTAFSIDAGVLQVYTKPAIGDTWGFIRPPAVDLGFTGFATVPVSQQQIYSWTFGDGYTGPNAWGKPLTAYLHHVNYVDSSLNGSGLEIGAGPANDRGVWLGLGGAARGDGKANWFTLASGASGNFKQRMAINGSGDTYIGPGGIGATSILIDNATGSVTIGSSSVVSYLTPSGGEHKLKVVGFSTFTDNVHFGNDWVVSGGGDGIFGLYYRSHLDPVFGPSGQSSQWGFVRATGAGTTAVRLSAPGYLSSGPYITLGTSNVEVTGALNVTGALSKGSGSFRIAHPLLPGKDLVHSFVEGPKCDLIYRGKSTLVAGSATVEMDSEVGLTAGTWDALTRDPQVFVVNNSGWTAVKGSVSGSTLTITAQDPTCTDEIDWMIVAERQDDNIKNADWTDSEGRPILEPDSLPQVENGIVEIETSSNLEAEVSGYCDTKHDCTPECYYDPLTDSVVHNE